MSREPNLLFQDLNDEQVGKMIDELSQSFPFKSAQIHFVSHKELQNNSAFKTYSEDPLNDVIGVKDLFSEVRAFVSPELKQENREAFLVRGKATSAILYHEVLHLCQDPTIFPTAYLSSKIALIMIEGITQYLTKQKIQVEKSYADYVRLVDIDMREEILTKKMLEDFSFKGTITPGIQALYLKFLSSYVEFWIVRLVVFLVNTFPEVDLNFFNLLKFSLPIQKNEMIDATVNYINEAPNTSIKKEFLSSLYKLFFSRNFLEENLSSKSDLEILSETLNKMKTMPSGARFYWVVTSDFEKKIKNTILNIKKIDNLTSPFAMLTKNCQSHLEKFTSLSIHFSIIKILKHQQDFFDKKSSLLETGLFGSILKSMKSDILHSIEGSMNEFQKDDSKKMLKYLEDLTNIQSKYIIFNQVPEFRNLVHSISEYKTALIEYYNMIKIENDDLKMSIRI